MPGRSRDRRAVRPRGRDDLPFPYNPAMEALNNIQLLAVLALPVVLAITVHEAAHGWVANRLGDKTALMLGRVTFNPLRHIDPIGTLLVPAATFLLAGFLFGWAKPVPVNARNLHDPRRDMALVAAAGPASNLAMAALWGLGIHIGARLLSTSEWIALPLVYMGAAGVLINVFLMILNLLPLLPLDGGRVLSALLPPRWSAAYSQLEPYGIFILLALLLTGLLSAVLLPLVVGTLGLLPGGGIVRELFFK
ncbi:MAG: site-2 protease family protein [Chromatiaceae bacterium]|nr:site-2 protease family protein [Chromatiaceae bacterium]